jgi:integrase
MQYATHGYQIRKGSQVRWERIDTVYMADPKTLSAKELDLLGESEGYGYRTTAIKDYFIKPTITNRAMTDAFMLIFLTGLRRKNVVEMKWVDVNWEANVLVIPEIKGQIKKNTIPLTHYTRAILEYRNKQKQRGDVYVFPKQRTRQKLNRSLFSEQYRRIAVWACMLDYTDEYENIRSLTQDRYRDKEEPEAYKKNPLAPLLDSLSIKGGTLDKLFPQVMAILFRNCKESMKKAKDKNLNVRFLVKDLGINPHGLRRTSANIARFLGRPQNIFLRHSGKTTDEKNYTAISPKDEQQYLSECHSYIDNRLFESLGDVNDYDDEKEGEFMSPFMKYYEQPVAIKKDDKFDMSKHSRNPLGEEEETLDADNALEELPTGLSNPRSV